MQRSPIHLKPGKRRIEVTGFNPNCRLDGFVFATNNELILKTLFNSLFCPTGFDEALIYDGDN